MKQVSLPQDRKADPGNCPEHGCCLINTWPPCLFSRRNWRPRCHVHQIPLLLSHHPQEPHLQHHEDHPPDEWHALRKYTWVSFPWLWPLEAWTLDAHQQFGQMDYQRPVDSLRTWWQSLESEYLWVWTAPVGSDCIAVLRLLLQLTQKMISS